MENKNVVDITLEMKRAERKARWRARFDKIKEFAQDNREVLVVAVPAVAGGGRTGVILFVVY